MKLSDDLVARLHAALDPLNSEEALRTEAGREGRIAMRRLKEYAQAQATLDMMIGGGALAQGEAAISATSSDVHAVTHARSIRAYSVVVEEELKNLEKGLRKISKTKSKVDGFKPAIFEALADDVKKAANPLLTTAFVKRMNAALPVRDGDSLQLAALKTPANEAWSDYKQVAMLEKPQAALLKEATKKLAGHIERLSGYDDSAVSAQFNALYVDVRAATMGKWESKVASMGIPPNRTIH